MNSQTKLTGLFGHPVAHSMSPVMHNEAFKRCGLNYRYLAFDILPENIEQAVTAIRALGMRGVNVTIPHKVAVMPYLDEIDEEAQIIGAVNTIVNENGRLIGYNTDGRGYVRSLIEETGLEVKHATVLLIGAGGAARGVAVALLRHGLTTLFIANRTVDKAEQLATAIQIVNPNAQINTLKMEEIPEIINEITVIVQTTSIGMHPNNEESPIPPEQLHTNLLVSDLIYNPLETRLLRDATKVGAKIHGGLGMFIYQGALSFEYWTGVKAPIQEMRAVVEKELQDRT